jgi:hypothetical protein
MKTSKKVIKDLLNGPISEVGEPVQTAVQVSVDTPPVQAQRMVYTNRADNYVKEVGYFDWRLFNVITCVQYPAGTIEVVDGGHRLYLAKKYTNKTTVPAVILKVNDEKDAATLFHRFNGTCSKSVNNEEKFVAQVLGEEAQALILEEGLIQCNASVKSAHNVVGAPNGKTITVSKWKALWKRDPQLTVAGCELLDSVFTTDSHFSPMLLEGVVTLMSKYEQYSVDWDKHADNFQAFMASKASQTPQNKISYPGLRKDNHYGISIAWGLYQDYFDWCKIHAKPIPFSKKQLQNDYNNAGI